MLPEYVQEILQVPFLLSEAETSSPGLYNGWLIFVIVAPVVEELLFRGMIFSRWANKWGVKRAIIFSSLLFGVLHVEGTLGAFVFGVVMALLYLRTRTLLIPIACHMLNNAIAVALGIWGFGLGDSSNLEDFRSMLWFAVIGLAVATPILFLYIYRAWGTLASGLPYFDSADVPATEPAFPSRDQCPRCGHSLPRGSRRCARCGTAISFPPVAAVRAPLPEPAIPPDPPAAS